jgi:hypothetical protein
MVESAARCAGCDISPASTIEIPLPHPDKLDRIAATCQSATVDRLASFIKAEIREQLRHRRQQRWGEAKEKSPLYLRVAARPGT